MSDTWRLFIALELPEGILRKLSRLQTDLAQHIPGRSIRWVNAAGIHLTLKFLGDTPVNQVDELERALRAAARPQQEFNLTIEGVGCFPDTRSPRVLWMGVGGETGRLADLQKNVEEYIAPLGFPAEKRTFSPHLTLARVKQGANRQTLSLIGGMAEQNKSGKLGSWQVASVSLMRSQLTREGAVYTCLSEAPLGS